jgi:hypothetical protein
VGWLHADHRVAGQVVDLLPRPGEEGVQPAVAIVRGGRLPALELIGDEASEKRTASVYASTVRSLLFSPRSASRKLALRVRGSSLGSDAAVMSTIRVSASAMQALETSERPSTERRSRPPTCDDAVPGRDGRI